MDISEKKEKFLESLQGNKLEYKRYTKQPLRYPGGKSLAVGEIIKYLPNELERVVSPFVGGASVEYAIANELDIEVLCFDIFEPLINFYNILKQKKGNLVKELTNYSLSEENYKIVKERLKIEWEEGAEDKVQYASDFFFNFGLSYGPGFLGWPSKKYLEESAYERMINKLQKTNFKNMKFKTATFENIIPKYKDDFLFLDPPYFIGGTSKMFAGIYPQRNFPIYHDSFNHELMAKQLKKHRGGFLITYNDCEEIRELYNDCEIIEKKWQYTMGQGETRIGKNRLDANNPTNIKQSHEIFVIGKKKENNE